MRDINGVQYRIVEDCYGDGTSRFRIERKVRFLWFLWWENVARRNLLGHMCDKYGVDDFTTLAEAKDAMAQHLACVARNTLVNSRVINNED